MKYKFLIAFALIIAINSEKNVNFTYNYNNNDKYLEWGLKNNLSLSSYIEVAYEDKNRIKFIAKEDIPKKIELLSIPNSLIFDTSKALELLNSKNLKKQFKEFSKLNLTYQPNPFDFRKEESFLSYLLYIMQHKSKKYKKTKFYEKYNLFFDSIEKYSIKSALYYDQSHIEYLAGTLFGHSIEVMRKIYEDEIDIFSKDTYYKTYIDYDEYVHNRFYVNNKGLNISNHWTLVPFLNYFDEDYTTYNANYTIDEKGDVKIMSRRKIKKGDEIVLKSKKMSNIRRLLTQGKTNEKLFDYFEEYSIYAVSPGLFYLYDLKEQEYDIFKNIYINLLDKDFESKATSIYLEHAGALKGDGSDTWAYEVLVKNLKFYLEKFEKMNLASIYKEFYEKDDRENVERIIRGEKKMVEKAFKKVMKTVNQFMDIQKKYMGKNKEGVIDL